MKQGRGLLTICLGVLLGLLAVPVFAEVPENERVLITNPAQLEAMGFRPDAQNVYMGTAAARAASEESRDFGINLAHYTGVSPKAFSGMTDTAGGPWQYSGGDGCSSNLCLSSKGTEDFAEAQINLPTGVDFTLLRYWARDTNAAANLAVYVFEQCLPTFTAGGETVTVIGSADPATTGSGGFQSNAISIAATTVDNRGCVYVVRVRFDATTGLTLQKVRVQWHRQISPAPVSATFLDVPTSHPFFQFIEALRDSGITTGCDASPPLYCPDDAVTRGQMAVFISKALGLTFP
jgi:hypothetical protein